MAETPRQRKPKLAVAKKDDGFVVQDENGVVYGTQVVTRKAADELLNDWKAYYDEPCSPPLSPTS